MTAVFSPGFKAKPWWVARPGGVPLAAGREEPAPAGLAAAATPTFTPPRWDTPPVPAAPGREG